MASAKAVRLRPAVSSFNAGLDWRTPRLIAAIPTRKFAFYGDLMSFNAAADVAGKLTGKAFERRSFATEANLRGATAKARPDTQVIARLLDAFDSTNRGSR
jgi:hypothetical protein